MAEYDNNIKALRAKMELKSARVAKRYKFYEMKHTAHDLQISTPPKLLPLTSCLGWCGKAVDGLADRLCFREFRNDELNMNEIYQQNNPDILTDSAVLSTLIASCSFAYISRGDAELPRIQIIDAGNATGTIDPITGLLTEGYAVLRRANDLTVVEEAYYTGKYTAYLKKGKEYRRDPNPTGYPLLVPIIYRPDAVRPFGHSRISRACMSIVDAAMRTVKRCEISAEFYSFPQKYVTGLSEDAETLDSWKAAMSALISFGKDRDGDSPKVGQFTQQSMQPHIDQIRMLASLFAGETGLTMDDMGFPSDNPSSSESIKASHETMRLAARKAQRCIGTGLLNTGFVAACLRDEKPYTRDRINKIRPIWEPAFEKDLSALSLAGDAVIKINQAVPDFFNRENLRDITGVDPGGEA